MPGGVAVVGAAQPIAVDTTSMLPDKLCVEETDKQQRHPSPKRDADKPNNCGNADSVYLNCEVVGKLSALIEDPITDAVIDGMKVDNVFASSKDTMLSQLSSLTCSPQTTASLLARPPSPVMCASEAPPRFALPRSIVSSAGEPF